MKFNYPIGEDRIVTKGRTAIINSGNVFHRQHSHNTGKTANRIKVKTDDLAVRIIGRITRLHMKRSIGFTHIIDIDGSSLNMERSTIMGQSKANAVCFKYARLHSHIRPPPHEHRRRA